MHGILFLTLGVPLNALRVRESSAITSRKEFWVIFPPKFHFSVGVLLLVSVLILPRGFYISGFNSNFYMSAR